MNNIVIIIPSRLNAERLPNKPLKLINNKEMILHVHATAKNSNVGQVIVATPDQEILELVKKNNVNIMIGHLLLFHPAINKMKQMISENKIGKLQYIYSNRLNLGTVRTKENVFWSFAPHDISIFQYFTDSFPENIFSNGAKMIQEDIHDTTLTFLEYPNNINCHIYVSWLHPFKEHRLVIIGSEGMLSFEDSAENKPLKF